MGRSAVLVPSITCVLKQVAKAGMPDMLFVLSSFQLSNQGGCFFWAATVPRNQRSHGPCCIWRFIDFYPPRQVQPRHTALWDSMCWNGAPVVRTVRCYSAAVTVQKGSSLPLHIDEESYMSSCRPSANIPPPLPLFTYHPQIRQKIPIAVLQRA